MSTTNWAISCGGSLSIPVAAGYGITLVDTDAQMMYDAKITGFMLGADFGVSASTFSPTFFTVSDPMAISDFDGKHCMLVDLGATAGIGGSMTGLTIYGVTHTPSVLDLGGFSVGVNVGAGIGPFMKLAVIDFNGRPNLGCSISPNADPSCTPGADQFSGGASTPPDPSQNSSVDTGTSQDPGASQ